MVTAVSSLFQVKHFVSVMHAFAVKSGMCSDAVANTFQVGIPQGSILGSFIFANDIKAR